MLTKWKLDVNSDQTAVTTLLQLLLLNKCNISILKVLEKPKDMVQDSAFSFPATSLFSTFSSLSKNNVFSNFLPSNWMLFSRKKNLFSPQHHQAHMYLSWKCWPHRLLQTVLRHWVHQVTNCQSSTTLTATARVYYLLKHGKQAENKLLNPYHSSFPMSSFTRPLCLTNRLP